MITELKPTNLIAVEVAQDASNYRFESKIEVMYDTEDNIWQQGDFELPPIISYKILGEVTKDKIGFDVEPYAEKEMNGFYKNYSWDGSGRYYGYLTPYDSFRSLLAINGLYFENPIKVSGKHIVGTITKLAQDWQSFEDKLIKGKLLILEKI